MLKTLFDSFDMPEHHGGRAWQVHHCKYVMKAMDGTNLGLLVSLCGPCHTFCEWDGDRKTMPSGANGRIKLPALR